MVEKGTTQWSVKKHGYVKEDETIIDSKRVQKFVKKDYVFDWIEKEIPSNQLSDYYIVEEIFDGVYWEEIGSTLIEL